MNIETEAEYDTALARAWEEIFSAKRGTPEGNELNLLIDLIEAYEAKVYPVGAPERE